MNLLSSSSRRLFDCILAVGGDIRSTISRLVSHCYLMYLIEGKGWRVPNFSDTSLLLSDRSAMADISSIFPVLKDSIMECLALPNASGQRMQDLLEKVEILLESASFGKEIATALKELSRQVKESNEREAERSTELHNDIMRLLSDLEKEITGLSTAMQNVQKQMDRFERKVKVDEFFRRFGDYCEDVLRFFRRETLCTLNEWIALEKKLLAEESPSPQIQEPTSPPLVRASPEVVHSHISQPATPPDGVLTAETQLKIVCEKRQVDYKHITRIIVIYKRRCENFHSGIHRMDAEEKLYKIRHNFAAIQQQQDDIIPPDFQEDLIVLQEVIKEYAKINDVSDAFPSPPSQTTPSVQSTTELTAGQGRYHCSRQCRGGRGVSNSHGRGQGAGRGLGAGHTGRSRGGGRVGNEAGQGRPIDGEGRENHGRAEVPGRGEGRENHIPGRGLGAGHRGRSRGGGRVGNEAGQGRPIDGEGRKNHGRREVPGRGEGRGRGAQRSACA